jgi:hypothetical protein
VNQKLLDIIKKRGYWRINFQPVGYKKRFESLSECKLMVEKCTVSLRGWRYPFLPINRDEHMGFGPTENSFEGWIDSHAHKEYWQFYESGQFIHYLALREDWVEGDIFWGSLATKLRPGEKLGVIGSTLYQITEIFQFLFRLTSAGVYNQAARVSIKLNNTNQRELWLEDDNRIPFSVSYRTGAESIEKSDEFDKEMILAKSNELALGVVKYIFDRFGWSHAPMDALKGDQQAFLEGKR